MHVLLKSRPWIVCVLYVCVAVCGFAVGRCVPIDKMEVVWLDGDHWRRERCAAATPFTTVANLYDVCWFEVKLHALPVTKGR